jgi:hypothetical protein
MTVTPTDDVPINSVDCNIFFAHISSLRSSVREYTSAPPARVAIPALYVAKHNKIPTNGFPLTNAEIAIDPIAKVMIAISTVISA